MGTVLRTGSDRLGKVWTSENRCEALFLLNRESHTVQIWPSPQTCVQFLYRASLETLRPSEVVETALRQASIGERCELVWSATFLGHFQTRFIIRKFSLSGVRMWNFTGIGPKTKKLWLSIVLARRPSEQPGLGPPQKGVNCNFSWPEFDKPYGVRKLSISDALIWSFSRMARKDKKLKIF